MHVSCTLTPACTVETAMITGSLEVDPTLVRVSLQRNRELGSIL